ncbi:WD domain [Trypanosoma vivax]|nr:WD domain [Trypanosoma vivax]
MLYDLAPPVNPKLLQRIAQQQGLSSTNMGLRPISQEPQWIGGLPIHLAAKHENVARAYPPPPAYLEDTHQSSTAAGDSGKSGLQRTVQTGDDTRQALKRPRSVIAPLPTSAVEGKDGDKVKAAALDVSESAPKVYFDKSFERTDYMGRSFLQPPPSLQVHNRECRLPRQMKGSCGKHEAGIQQLQWVPPVGHLLFAADLKGEARLYESFGSHKRCVATFVSHTQPVKSLEVTPDATVMSTGSVDGTVALWDVELGECRGVLTNAENLPCVQHLHHPLDPSSHILVALDRKVVLYDIRASLRNYQREYTGHMGTIFNLTLLSGGKKLLTTAEDKTLRTWDFRVPVQIKQIADVSMHAITHVAHHPTEDMLVAQSLNNQALVFADGGGGQVKLLRHRVFSGHTISGTRCQLAFSPDGRFLSSGDINGKLFIWSWSTGELLRSFTAHTQTLVSHRWHPVEVSRVVTSAWDGVIKNWS